MANDSKATRPLLTEAASAVRWDGVQRGWRHADPAGVCRNRIPGFHPARERNGRDAGLDGAVQCEHNSQLIAWKRDKYAAETALHG